MPYTSPTSGHPSCRTFDLRKNRSLSWGRGKADSVLSFGHGWVAGMCISHCCKACMTFEALAVVDTEVRCVSFLSPLSVWVVIPTSMVNQLGGSRPHLVFYQQRKLGAVKLLYEASRACSSVPWTSCRLGAWSPGTGSRWPHFELSPRAWHFERSTSQPLPAVITHTRCC